MASPLQPLEQFGLVTLGPQLTFGTLNVSFNKSALMMAVTVLVATLFMLVAMRHKALVPGRLQSLAETLYEFVASMLEENGGGHEAKPYFPFVFSIFIFILLGNLLGMIPYSFTFTSHIIVTFALAATVFLFVTILGLVKHGLHFFTFFMPAGAPVWLMPLIIPIEVLSYLSRPVSLSIRLFANMMAGHTMMVVFGSFTVMLAAGLGAIGWFAGVFPILINIALVGLEFFVAMLQAYVFTILTCLYIRDALELH